MPWLSGRFRVGGATSRFRWEGVLGAFEGGVVLGAVGEVERGAVLGLEVLPPPELLPPPPPPVCAVTAPVKPIMTSAERIVRIGEASFLMQRRCLSSVPSSQRKRSGKSSAKRKKDVWKMGDQASSFWKQRNVVGSHRRTQSPLIVRRRQVRTRR